MNNKGSDGRKTELNHDGALTTTGEADATLPKSQQEHTVKDAAQTSTKKEIDSLDSEAHRQDFMAHRDGDGTGSISAANTPSITDEPLFTPADDPSLLPRASVLPGAFRIRGVDATRSNSTTVGSRSRDATQLLVDERHVLDLERRAMELERLQSCTVQANRVVERDETGFAIAEEVHAVDEHSHLLRKRQYLVIFALVVISVIAIVSGTVAIIQSSANTNSSISSLSPSPSTAAFMSLQPARLHPSKAGAPSIPSMIPTPAVDGSPVAVDERFHSLRTRLVGVVPSDVTSEHTSAQYQALQWLGINYRDDEVDTKTLIARYVLAVFYFSMTTTRSREDSDEANYLETHYNWMSNESICFWNGVNNVGNTIGVICDGDGIGNEVTGLVVSEYTQKFVWC